MVARGSRGSIGGLGDADRGNGLLVAQPFDAACRSGGMFLILRCVLLSHIRDRGSSWKERRGACGYVGGDVVGSRICRIWGDFRAELGERLMDFEEAGLFCGRDFCVTDCLKQDLQDFGEIFGIAGERLMVGRRVFFAAGERAGCGGAIIGDAPMYARLAPSWHRWQFNLVWWLVR